MTRLYLGVDVGTSSTKATALNRHGAVVATAAVPHDVRRPRPGWFEHDARQVWWLNVAAVLRRLLSALPGDSSVQALGLTCCGPCLVPVDHDGRPVGPGILYGVDSRATSQVQRLERELGADRIRADFEMPLTSQSVGPKIDWLAEVEPAIYAETAHLLTINSFTAWHLTGEMRIDHHQAAYFAPYYRAGRWDPTHDRTGVCDRLPTLAWSEEVVGAVSAAAAAETGLPEGLPVIIGSSDGVTAAYGAGAIEEGSAVLNYGSTLGLTAMTGRAIGTGGVWRTPGAKAGQTSLVAGLATSGALLTWFIDRFAPELAQDPVASYRALAAEAELSPPGASGLLLLPYFAGERTPIYDPGAAGVLLGLRLDHKRGDHYRAILEGTAFGARHLLAEFATMGVQVNRLCAVGGGTGSRLWQQIVADVTGVPQEVVASRGGAAAGAALLAALGSGQLDAPWSPPIAQASEIFRPRDALRSLYDQRYGLFREAYERTRPLIAGLAATDDRASGGIQESNK